MKLTKNNTLKSILACDKLTRDQISDYIKIRFNIINEITNENKPTDKTPIN